MKLPKFLDCTLRDGGYINQWDFSWTFAHALFSAIWQSGGDYIEIGFFDPTATKGLPWSNLAASDIAKLRERNHEAKVKVAVMINFGSVALEEVPDQPAYGADMIRVAAHKSQAAEAAGFAAALHGKGYVTTVNFMGISNYTNAEILSLLDIINAHKDTVDYFYVADSFGSLLPKRTREIFTTLRFGTEAKLGFHPHNNMQLAFANCLEAIEAGVDIIDGSVFGMGRGAGNLFTEAVLAWLETQNPQRFRVMPVLQFADLFMEAMKADYSWGYSLPQLLSGIMRCHPNYPTNLLKEKAFTADDIYKMLSSLEESSKPRFNLENMNGMKQAYLQGSAEAANVSISPGLMKLCQRSKGIALLVCGGSSVIHEKAMIDAFIKREKPAVISVNNPAAPFDLDAVFFGNRRRLLQHSAQVSSEMETIFSPEIHPSAEKDFGLHRTSRINSYMFLREGDNPFPLLTPENSAIEAVIGLVQTGFHQVYICGLDGYATGKNYYYQEADQLGDSEQWARENLIIRNELIALFELQKDYKFNIKLITKSQFSE